MYKCPDCGCIYDEPYEYEECLESYYGVSGMFQDTHYSTFRECPQCGSFHDESWFIDEEEEEDYE